MRSLVTQFRLLLLAILLFAGSAQAELTIEAGIHSAIQNNWLQPPSTRPGMQCKVRVNLIPGGDVAEVRIVESSGDAAFDRSVENAVRKAAPLPLPSDPKLFDHFRELTFVFKSEN